MNHIYFNYTYNYIHIHIKVNFLIINLMENCDLRKIDEFYHLLEFENDNEDQWFDKNSHFLKKIEEEFELKKESFQSNINNVNIHVTFNENEEFSQMDQRENQTEASEADESLRTISTYHTYENKKMCFRNRNNSDSNMNNIVNNQNEVRDKLNNHVNINNINITSVDENFDSQNGRGEYYMSMNSINNLNNEYKNEEDKENQLPSPKTTGSIKDLIVFLTEISNLHMKILKNPFDLAFYFYQTILYRHKTYRDILIYPKLHEDLIILMNINLKVSQQGKIKESNMRKRAKCLFNRVIIQYINILLCLIYKDECYLYNKGFLFNDPHKKGNINIVNLKLIDILSNEKSDYMKLSIIIKDLVKRKEELLDPLIIVYVNLLEKLIFSSYESLYKNFFNSKFYTKIIFNNVKSILQSNECLMIFDELAIRFIEFLYE